MKFLDKLGSAASELKDRALRRGQHYPNNRRVIDPRKTPMETQAILALYGGRFELEFREIKPGRYTSVLVEDKWVNNHPGLGGKSPDPRRRDLVDVDAFRRDDPPGFADEVKRRGKEYLEIGGNSFEAQREIHDLLRGTIEFYPGHNKDRKLYGIWQETEFNLDQLNNVPGLTLEERRREFFDHESGRARYFIGGTRSYVLLDTITVAQDYPGPHVNFFINPQTGRLHAYHPAIDDRNMNILRADVAKELAKLRELISTSCGESLGGLEN